MGFLSSLPKAVLSLSDMACIPHIAPCSYHVVPPFAFWKYTGGNWGWGWSRSLVAQLGRDCTGLDVCAWYTPLVVSSSGGDYLFTCCSPWWWQEHPQHAVEPNRLQYASKVLEWGLHWNMWKALMPGKWSGIVKAREPCWLTRTSTPAHSATRMPVHPLGTTTFSTEQSCHWFDPTGLLLGLLQTQLQSPQNRKITKQKATLCPVVVIIITEMYY